MHHMAISMSGWKIIKNKVNYTSSVVYVLNQLTKYNSSSLRVICLSRTVTRTIKKKCTSQVFSKKIIFILNKYINI